jgi:hypothetical protein
MVYSGKRLFNANNGAFLFMILFCLLIIANNEVYIGIAFFFLCLLFTANEAFYFEITEYELGVKNYMLPFINIRYQLNEITCVELNGTRRRSTADAALKVIRDDKSSMGFKSASLNLKDWQALVNDLGGRKIAVTVSASRLIDKIGLPE